MRLRDAAGAGLILLAASATPAAASGLFDLLMGGVAPSAAAPPTEEAGTLTVHRRHARPRPARPRVARARPAADAAAHKPEIAIDPNEVADWYLRDRTLRRGDIIVLKSGALVYKGHGGEVRRPADFARLRDARFLPARTRDFVAKATAANATAAVAVSPTRVARPKAHQSPT